MKSSIYLLLLIFILSFPLSSYAQEATPPKAVAEETDEEPDCE